MLDPGTALATVSLALQVLNGLSAYFQCWRDCEGDVQHVQNCLLRLARIFKQLEITLAKPQLEQNLVSTICSTIRASTKNVDELRAILDKTKIDDATEGIMQRLKAKGRKACYPFRASTVARLSEIIDDLKDDLNLAIGVLSLYYRHKQFN